MPFPRIEACLVCEGAREEVHNKHVLLGFFGITPHVQIRMGNFQSPAVLCFVFCGGPGSAGTYDVSLQLTDPQGLVVSNPSASPDIRNGRLEDRLNTNIFMGFHGLLTVPGRYRVALVVNGAEHYSSTVDVQPMSR